MIYACHCGWTGVRPSFTDASDLRPGADGTLVMDRRHLPVCPSCFYIIAPAPPAKEITVNDTANHSPVLAIMDARIEAEATALVRDAIQIVRNVAIEQALRLVAPGSPYPDRDMLLRAAVSTADCTAHIAALRKIARESLAAKFVAELSLAIRAAKAPEETPDQSAATARPNGKRARA